MKVSIKLLSLAVGLTLMQPCIAANLVVNGNFSTTYAGFTSDYNQVASQQPTGPGGMFAEGTYTVEKDPFTTHNSWQKIPTGNPYNTTDGKMLIVNGSSVANAVVWKTAAPIPVIVGQGYSFQAYETNLYAPDLPATNGAKLNYSYSYDNAIWASLGVTDLSGAISGVWTASNVNQFTASGSSLWLRITNSQTALNGNDFALGLVSLTAIPEPSSSVAIGLLLGVFVMGRRRTV